MELENLNTETVPKKPATRGTSTETELQTPATRVNHFDEYKKKYKPLFQVIVAAIIILGLFYSLFMTGAKTSTEDKIQTLEMSTKLLLQVFGIPAISPVHSEWPTNSTKH